MKMLSSLIEKWEVDFTIYLNSNSHNEWHSMMQNYRVRYRGIKLISQIVSMENIDEVEKINSVEKIIKMLGKFSGCSEDMEFTERLFEQFFSDEDFKQFCFDMFYECANLGRWD